MLQVAQESSALKERGKKKFLQNMLLPLVGAVQAQKAARSQWDPIGRAQHVQEMAILADTIPVSIPQGDSMSHWSS